MCHNDHSIQPYHESKNVKALFNCRSLTPQFSPVWEESPYLLPICNKPLIEYWLDLCVWLNIKEALVVEYDALNLAPYTNRQEEWGLQLTVVPGDADEVLTDLLLRFQHFLQDDLLFVDGMMFPFYDHKTIKPVRLKQEDNLIYNLETGHFGFEETALMFPQQTLKNLVGPMDDNTRFYQWTHVQREQHPDLNFKMVRPRNLLEFMQLSLKVLHQHSQFSLKGFEVAPGVFEGLNNDIVARPHLKGPLLTGNSCRISAEADLEHVILGNQVRLEGNTQLKQCLVYGPVYLGNIQLKNTLIWEGESLNPMTGERSALPLQYQLKQCLEDPEQREVLYAQEAEDLKQLLRWRKPLFQALQWHVPFQLKKYYINAMGETLTLPVYECPENPTPLQRLFFHWHLQWVPFFQAVQEQRLLLVGTRLLPAEQEQLAYISRLPVYAPGVFSHSPEVTTESLTHWMEELHFCSQFTLAMRRQILARYFPRFASEASVSSASSDS